jgi:hypothetical protein
VLIHDFVVGRGLCHERFDGDEIIGLKDRVLALELTSVLKKFVHILTLLVSVSVTWSRGQRLTKSGLHCH